ncbi:BTB domain-containing protein [Favolaschia claudopus]|uniref:BTB domain-containing protein n=1 Tax=Favolaschia claudopus TaxID=2862362 RepID=A0AAW0AYB1_9AGAR
MDASRSHQLNSSNKLHDSSAQVDDLWFTNTLIVIQAEDKVFRVPGGILAARSTVFRDMIAFPQPKSNEDFMDGCPVVRLQDPSKDVEVFLRAIYDSSYFMPAPAAYDLYAVLGILRLSHKYDVPYLHNRALEHLAAEGYFPAGYEDIVEQNHLIMPGTLTPVHALSVIAAAAEVGAFWLLPYAYYCAATFSVKELLPFLDGTLCRFALQALEGHADLTRAIISMHRFLTARQFETCTATQTCNVARNKMITELLNLVSVDAVDVFDMAKKVLRYLTSNGRLCTECANIARTKQHEGASAFWNELPQIFGLQSWGELRALRRIAMGEDTSGR